MGKVRLKYVHQFVDRRSGKARFYFRRRGFPRVPLPGLPGSAEFMAAYARALALPMPQVGRSKPGTIAALVALYLSSAKFLARPASTQSTYRNIVERFRNEHGNKPIADLERRHLEAMLAQKAKTPAAANHWLRLIKVLMAIAVKEGWRADNPAAHLERIQARSDGFHTWTEVEISQFEKFHPVGSREQLAFALLLFTAQRRSDVVHMGRKHVRGDVVDVRQQKTGKFVPVPLHAELARILAATPASITPTFLMTAYGQPFSAAGFGGWFRACCDAAGLPQECTAHGLRKAAARRLAEAGCSASVIAAILGHTSLREVEIYVRAAEQERLARIGMAAIANVGRTSN